MNAIRLKTEHLFDPLGIDVRRPRLMWNAEGGVKQRAYEIVTDKWQSGKVESDEMHAIYPLPLTSRERVNWKVRLWDENDQPGDWAQAFFEMGLLTKDDWTAQWITGDYRPNRKERYPVDCFSKTFTLDKPVKSARLYATACGLYEARLGGKKVGDFVMAPGYTDYRKHVQYQTYDVTGMLRKGENELTVQLADGWYRGSCGAWGKKNQYGTETKLLLQLEITFMDGSRQVIGTDPSWAWSNDGPIRQADNKDGEIVEAFRTPMYTGKAKVTKHSVTPTASNNVPVTEHETFHPVITTAPNGRKLLNFGQNMAGYIRFSLNAKLGQRMVWRFGEMLDADGNFTQKNIQLSGGGRRGAERRRHRGRGGLLRSGADGGLLLLPRALEQALYRHPLVRQGEPSGHPHGLPHPGAPRLDRRCAALFHHGVLPLRLRALREEVPPRRLRLAEEERPPPSHHPRRRRGLLYVDHERLRGLVRRGRPDPLAICSDQPGRFHPSGVLRRHGQIRPVHGEPLRQEHALLLRAREAEPRGQEVFRQSGPELRRVGRARGRGRRLPLAGLRGPSPRGKEFQTYSDGCKAAYRELVKTVDYSLDTDKQARLVRPLYFDLLDEEQTAFAKKRLTEALEHYRWRLGTGFLSTPLILYVLADMDPEAAYRLLENEEVPGWLSMPKAGATTIWEAWEGPNSREGGIGSLNHYSKGAVVEWLFSTMCGIRVTGENRFTVAPLPGGSLTHAEACYTSVFGKISSKWEKEDGKITYTVTVPANCEAEIILPKGLRKTVGAGTWTFREE